MTDDATRPIRVTSGAEGRQFAMVVRAFTESDAKPAQRCAFMAICLFADGNTWLTEEISHVVFAKHAGIERETFTRAAAWLEAEGWIEVYEPEQDRDARGRLAKRAYSIAPALRRERERFAALHAPTGRPRRRRSTGDLTSPVPAHTGDLTSPAGASTGDLTSPATGDLTSQYSDQRSETSAGTPAPAHAGAPAREGGEAPGPKPVLERGRAFRARAELRHDGLAVWEHDALVAFGNTEVEEFLRPIEEEGSALARSRAEAARAEAQVRRGRRMAGGGR